MMIYRPYKVKLLLTFVVTLTLFPLADNSKPFSTNGYMRFDLSSLYRKTDDSLKPFLTSSLNMLTVNIRTTNIKHAKIEGLFDIYNVYGYYRDLYRISKATDAEVFYKNDPFFFDILMLYGSLYLPWLDFTFGRQIVNFGSGKLFSPLNIYSTVNIFDLSFKRKGKDIVMAKIPLGDLSGIDIASEIPLSEELPHLSSMKLFTNLYGWQFIFATLYKHHTEDIAAGISVKGDLIAGIYSELMINYNRLQKKYNYEIMCGGDYSIKKTFIFALEYYFRNNNESSFFPDKHNLFFSTTYSLNELMNTSFYLIEAFPSKNLIATFQYSWSILQSVTTIFFMRYYHLEALSADFPKKEAGVRIEIRF